MTLALLGACLCGLGWLLHRTFAVSLRQSNTFAQMQALFPKQDTRRMRYREPDARWRVKP